MAKSKNTLTLDSSGLKNLMATLLRVEHANAPKVIEGVLVKAAERVQADTHIALSKAFLPAHGIYWTGKTAESIEEDTHVRWEGSTAWVPVGFDFNQPGAGGYLISGTPKMNPDKELHKIYREKKYMQEIQEQMWDEVEAHIQEAWKKK